MWIWALNAFLDLVWFTVKKKKKNRHRAVEANLTTEELMETGTFKKFHKTLESVFEAAEDVDLNMLASSECSHMTRITRKQTLRSLSLSYQKMDGRDWLFRIWPCWHHRLYSQKVGVMPIEGWARPHTHPSFGMTTTKTSRSVFSWRTSYMVELTI